MFLMHAYDILSRAREESPPGCWNGPYTTHVAMGYRICRGWKHH